MDQLAVAPGGSASKTVDLRAGGDAARPHGLAARPGRQGLADGDAGRAGQHRDRHRRRSGRPASPWRPREPGARGMSDGDRVLWSEGLFLRPQHFQQQDRPTEALVRGALQAGAAARLGLRVARRSTRRCSRPAAIAVTAARGIFPDGTPFAIPETMDPPEPVAIGRDTPAGRGAAGAAAGAAGRRELRPGARRALRRPLPRPHRAGARRGRRRRRARGDRDRPPGGAAARARAATPAATRRCRSPS